MPGNPQLRTGLALLKTAAAPGRAARTISVTVERSEPRAVVHQLGDVQDTAGRRRDWDHTARQRR